MVQLLLYPERIDFIQQNTFTRVSGHNLELINAAQEHGNFHFKDLERFYIDNKENFNIDGL